MLALKKLIPIEFSNSDPGVFREIPLDLPGHLYTSPMPFGAYDRGSRLLKIYKKNHIQHVFVLATDKEIENKARRNLFQSYKDANIRFTQFSIKDYQSPSVEVLSQLVEDAKYRLRDDQRIVIHCHAGVGRSAVAASSVVMITKNITAKQAIQYVKEYMEINITSEQTNLITKFEEKLRSQSN